MSPPISRAVWLAVGICLSVGSAVEDAGCGGPGAEELEVCAPSQSPEDEDAEALAASTLLLQSSALHSRAPARRGALASSLSVDSQRGGAALEHHVHDGRAALRPGALRFEPVPVVGEVLANRERPESDPFWGAMHDRIVNVTMLEPGAAMFVQLCRSGDLAKYTTLGCSPNYPGSIMVDGFPADAFFCGSSRLNWSSAPFPTVANLCSAKLGSAYDPDGLCGRLSKKQLVVNYAESVPYWATNAWWGNVPSIGCMLGSGNCDMHYCQNCPGRCP